MKYIYIIPVLIYVIVGLFCFYHDIDLPIYTTLLLFLYVAAARRRLYKKN